MAPTMQSTLLSSLVRCGLRWEGRDPVSSDALGAGNQTMIEVQYVYLLRVG